MYGNSIVSLFFPICVIIFLFFLAGTKLNKRKKNGNAEKNHGKITIPNEYAIYCAHKFVDVSCCSKYIKHI